MAPHSSTLAWKMHGQRSLVGCSLPITSLQKEGRNVVVTDFIFLGSKITADSNCSHEVKRRLLLGRKAVTNLDSLLKQRHHFANKCLSSQGYGFSSSHVWM